MRQLVAVSPASNRRLSSTFATGKAYTSLSNSILHAGLRQWPQRRALASSVVIMPHQLDRGLCSGVGADTRSLSTQTLLINSPNQPAFGSP
ncbi:hypothetical protein CGRA01v4_00827 [Colletotrichum graminicola]|nr:hypothetical protein CGRA01v4_00827 [Colletotrichum graminicola]